MNVRKLAPALGLTALVVAVGAASYLRRADPTPPLLPFQSRVGELRGPDQERHEQIRAALREAERERSASKTWPPALSVPGLTWTMRAHGVYVNYVGVPAQAPGGLRWLVLIIEPEPGPLTDPVPPEDDEHHTLADGTGLHVTVWTSPVGGRPVELVLPMPAAEGWTQQVR